MVDQQHLEAALAGLGRAEEAGGACADDDGVESGCGVHQPFQVKGNFSCFTKPFGT